VHDRSGDSCQGEIPERWIGICERDCKIFGTTRSVCCREIPEDRDLKAVLMEDAGCHALMGGLIRLLKRREKTQCELDVRRLFDLVCPISELKP
jgi:hypothetical protein